MLLANALARLPEDYREVITLRHVEGRSFEEIAAAMGRTSGAVRMLWMRALERLGEADGGRRWNRVEAHGRQPHPRRSPRKSSSSACSKRT